MHTRTPKNHSVMSNAKFSYINKVGSAIDKEIELEKLTDIIGINNQRIVAAAMLAMRHTHRDSIKDVIRLVAYVLDKNPDLLAKWKLLNTKGIPPSESEFLAIKSGVANNFEEICNFVFDKNEKAAFDTTSSKLKIIQPVHRLLLPSFKLCSPVKISEEFRNNMSSDLLDVLSKFACNLTRKLSTIYSADDKADDSHHPHHKKGTHKEKMETID